MTTRTVKFNTETKTDAFVANCGASSVLKVDANTATLDDAEYDLTCQDLAEGLSVNTWTGSDPTGPDAPPE